MIETGEKGAKKKPDFSDIFGAELCQLAAEDPRICAITAAMSSGCGLNEFAARFPDRFFDVGIAEQHALTFAGGLAKNGMKPVFAVYSSFLQRGFDQIIHDLALQNVSVILGIDRAGIVGEDGETHQGLFDIPMMLSIPGIRIYSPTGYDDLRTILAKQLQSGEGITAIRYPKGYEPDMSLPFTAPEENAEWIGASADFCVVSYGRQVVSCLAGIRKANVPVAFLKLNRIFPIEKEVVSKLLKFKKIIVIEECYQNNGIGAYLGNQLITHDYQGLFRNLGIKNGFLKAGQPDDLLQECHLDADSIAEVIRKMGAIER